MARVITKACLGALHRCCAEVCPVDCFYYIKDKALNDKYGAPPANGSEYGMLMINPDECINCGACEGECPAHAIYEDSAVPDELKEFIDLNASCTTCMSDEEKDKTRCVMKS